MKHATFAGIALIVVGLAALVVLGVRYTTDQTLLALGPAPATTEQQRAAMLPPLFGFVAVAGGVTLLVTSARRRG